MLHYDSDYDLIARSPGSRAMGCPLGTASRSWRSGVPAAQGLPGSTVSTPAPISRNLWQNPHLSVEVIADREMGCDAEIES